MTAATTTSTTSSSSPLSTAVGINNVVYNGPSGKFNDLSKKFDEWLKEGRLHR